MIMKDNTNLQSLSDNELLRRLWELLQNSRRVEADLIGHIAEVDRRRLYARHSPSLFVYCTEVLHLSEHEAYLRIEVSRASRKHPVLFQMLADGRLHLSGIAVLHKHLTEANRRNTPRTSHSQVQAPESRNWLAELNPRPDVPPTIRKLPERPSQTKAPPSDRPQLGPDRSRTDFERGIRTKRCRSRHTCDGPKGLSADPAGRSKTPISGALQGRLYGQCRALRQARAAPGAHASLGCTPPISRRSSTRP